MKFATKQRNASRSAESTRRFHKALAVIKLVEGIKKVVEYGQLSKNPLQLSQEESSV